jgi:hypothetical protein
VRLAAPRAEEVSRAQFLGETQNSRLSHEYYFCIAFASVGDQRNTQIAINFFLRMLRKRCVVGRSFCCAIVPFLGGRQMTLAPRASVSHKEGHTSSPISLDTDSSSPSLVFFPNYHPYSRSSSTHTTRSHSQISSHEVFFADCISPLPSTLPQAPHISLSSPTLSSTNQRFNTHLTLFPPIAPHCGTFSQKRTAKNHVLTNSGHCVEVQRNREKQINSMQSNDIPC